MKNLYSTILLSLLIFTPLHSNAQIPASQGRYWGQFESHYESNGNNGAGLCFNPNKSLYYTVFAGNANFDLEVFNSEHTVIYKGPISADVRSLWFNPKKNILEGVLFNNEGSFQILLDEQGIPQTLEITDRKFGHNPQYGATFNPKKGEIIFVENMQIHIYKGKKKRTIKLNGTTDNLVESAPQWTGIPGYELAILGTEQHIVYLFDYKSGKQTAQVAIPDFDGKNIYILNCGYSQKEFFLFQKELKIWYGYTIFQ